MAVILDGENAWEYFPDDGQVFLNKLYQKINDDPLIETVTMSQASESLKPTPLKSIFAGSWISHNFKIWIGHDEDNAAWDLLTSARETLVEFIKNNPGYDTEKITKAWKQIYIAEGSDWCWWYGDEHRGEHNEQFDKIFRRHLIAVYENIGQEIPFQLLNPIYHKDGGVEIFEPSALVTPKLDGLLTHYYEWTGAGYYDCLKGGGAMHRVDRHVSDIYFAYDHENVYIRLDFTDKNKVELLKYRFRLVFYLDENKTVELDLADKVCDNDPDKDVRYCFKEVLEIALKRSYLLPAGYGSFGLTVALYEQSNKVESSPENEPINIEIPEKNKELFWPS